jgi:hypothetical protein
MLRIRFNSIHIISTIVVQPVSVWLQHQVRDSTSSHRSLYFVSFFCNRRSRNSQHSLLHSALSPTCICLGFQTSLIAKFPSFGQAIFYSIATFTLDPVTPPVPSGLIHLFQLIAPFSTFGPATLYSIATFTLDLVTPPVALSIFNYNPTCGTISQILAIPFCHFWSSFESHLTNTMASNTAEVKMPDNTNKCPRCQHGRSLR